MFNTQISDYDCGSISLLNALKYFYKKDEIPIDIIKIIYKNSLDSKNKIIGDCGTSKKAMKKIVKKLNKYCVNHNFSLKFKYLEKELCQFKDIKGCIDNNGIVIVRSILELDHYYLITNIDDDYVYIWDPYLEERSFMYYNIKIEINKIDAEKENNYALGNFNKRECILINNID